MHNGLIRQNFSRISVQNNHCNRHHINFKKKKTSLLFLLIMSPLGSSYPTPFSLLYRQISIHVILSCSSFILSARRRFKSLVTALVFFLSFSSSLVLGSRKLQTSRAVSSSVLCTLGSSVVNYYSS